MNRPAAPSRIGLAVWAAAAAGAVALHAIGAGAAFWLMSRDDPAPELGAPAIEIGVEMQAPRGETPQLPPGPDADASAPVPGSLATTTKQAAPDLPTDQPVETPEPDQQASPERMPQPPKPSEVAPAVNAASAAPAIESDAAAIPKSRTTEQSSRSVAPAIGVGENFERVRASWAKELVAHLNRFKRYPSGEKGESAEIVVALVLDESGRVASANILHSSGRPAFDEAALAMVRRADPVPKPPALVAQAGLSFALPVIFRPGAAIH